MAFELKRTVRNNLWMGASTLGVSIIAIISFGFVVRTLGETRAGVVGVISAILAASSALAGAGFAASLVRESSRHQETPERVAEYAGTTLTIGLVMGSLCCLGMAAGTLTLLEAIDFMSERAQVNDAMRYGSLAGGAVILTQCSAVYRALLHARSEFRASSRCDLTYSAVQGTGIIIALVLHPTLMSVGVVNLVAALGQWLQYRRAVRTIYGRLFRPSWSPAAFRGLWSFGKWHQMGSLFVIIGDSLDRVFLGAYFGAAAVPGYNLAKSFYSNMHGLLASQVYFLFPSLARNPEGISEERERRLTSIVMLLASWIYLGVFGLAPVVVSFISGPDFAAKMLRVLPVFCMLGWINALCLVNYYVKMAAGRSRIVATMYVLAGPGAICSMVVLGANFGLEWAAYGQLASALGMLWLVSLGSDDRPSWSLLWRRLRPQLPLFLFAFGVAATLQALAGMAGGTALRILLTSIILVSFVPLFLQLIVRLQPGSPAPAAIAELITALPVPEHLKQLLGRFLGVWSGAT
jgi:O-antigen/teichoic acid export membrane protein